MSNAEYVAELDEDQLTNLIEQATARREQIRQSGFIKLWQVSIGWANIAWFVEDDYAAAVEFACSKVNEYAAKQPGKGIEMEVGLERFRPTDVADLLKAKAAPTHQPAPQTSSKEGAKPLTRCAANRDGECGHSQCPQLRDNEPHATGRHCPLDIRKEDD